MVEEEEDPEETLEEETPTESPPEAPTPSLLVAAASKAAKFWQSRGGFRSEIISTKKIGQVHFLWKGDYNKMYCVFDEAKTSHNKRASS